ncbi:MAG TPA: membrane protein insertion efficiency factor YidD [Nostocaceae cyanobacterium]|nr:membrane protein insertion efficiency factor YidD [Nostocaceae cyanobacterium]
MLSNNNLDLNDISRFADTVKRIALLDVGEATDYMTRKAAISSIRSYQKHISPRKGFACACRIIYGESCSERIKNIIQEVGLFNAGPLARQQFALCRNASLLIKTQYSSRDCDDASLLINTYYSVNKSNCCIDGCIAIDGIGTCCMALSS